jgi:hypothetical protein
MSAFQPRELVLLDTASRALAEAHTIDEIRDIRDRAEAVRCYARSAALGLQVQNHAAEVKLQAERKAGKMLCGLRMRGGDRKSNRYHGQLKLADIGVSQTQSKRWQKEASVPAEVFREYIAAANEAGRELTTRGLLRLAARLANNRRDVDERGNGHGKCPLANRAVGVAERINSDKIRENPAEIVAELQQHRNLLASILEPIWLGEEMEFKRGERKGIEHLLIECELLLGRLGQMLADTERPPTTEAFRRAQRSGAGAACRSI